MNDNILNFPSLTIDERAKNSSDLYQSANYGVQLALASELSRRNDIPSIISRINNLRQKIAILEDMKSDYTRRSEGLDISPDFQDISYIELQILLRKTNLDLLERKLEILQREEENV